LEAFVDCSLEDSFAGFLEGSFGDSLEGSFDGSLEGSFGASFGCSFGGSFGGSVDGCLAGCFDGCSIYDTKKHYTQIPIRKLALSFASMCACVRECVYMKGGREGRH